MSRKEELIKFIEDKAVEYRESGVEDAVKINILGIGTLYVELDKVENFCSEFRKISPN
jgi:hypothetical protein